MQITATDLVDWAGRMSASSDFPDLIRRLVLATSHAKVSMRAGEGVRLPGFDGIVECQEKHSYLPEGPSVWEMGTGVEVADKANEDYKKRTADPLTVERTETTFVFVTPRRWSKKEQWVADRKAEGQWKDIYVYDADDLEGWLSTAPSVNAWLASLLDKPSAGIFNVEAYWENWANVTTPPLVPEILLAGWNDDPAEQVKTFLTKEPSTLSISAESPEVAAVYFAALLIKDGGQLEQSLARTVFVQERAVWDKVVLEQKPLILVPLFEYRNQVTAAVHQGHHVVIPLGRSSQSQSAYRSQKGKVQLKRQRRRDLREALEPLDLPYKQKEPLATLGRRTLLGLRRKLAYVPEIHALAWASPEQAQALKAPTLAGVWSAGGTGDQQMLSELSGRPYADVEQDVIRLSNEDDPPIRKTAGVWLINSKADAWNFVAPFLSQTDIERFEQVILKVVGTVDPQFELPEEQRPLASVLKKELPYSGLLREELLNSLVLMVVDYEDELKLASSPQEIADRIVRKLLSSKDLNAWRTMAWVLPKLAEAAPEEFLKAVKRALDTGEPHLPELFQQQSLSFSSPAYPPLLWALERLAWSSEYFQRVSLLLGRLWEATSEQKLHDGAGQTLLKIYTLWYRNTVVSLEKKIEVIDVLRQQMPEVAWSLMEALVPVRRAYCDPVSQPDWRDWGQWKPREIPDAEYQEGATQVLDRLLEDAEGHLQRIIILFAKLERMSRIQYEAFCGLLESIFSTGDVREQRKLRDKLRDFISQHQRWNTSEEKIEQLEALLEKYKPEDLVERHRWLFRSKKMAWLNTVRFDENREQYFKELHALQEKILEEIIKAEGMPGVVRLLKSFNEDDYGLGIGRTLAQCEKLDVEQWRTLLDTGEAGRKCLGELIQNRWFHEEKEEVIAELTSSKVSSWDKEERTFLLLNLPCDEQTWDAVATQGDEIHQLYWQRLNYQSLPNYPIQEISKAVDQFLEVGRVDAVFDLAWSNRLELTGEKWVQVLRALVQSDANALHNRIYEIQEVLDLLSEQDGLERIEGEVAQLAWMILPLIDGVPKVLSKIALNNPQFFADIIKLAFSNDEEHVHRNRARDLMRELRGIPGTQANGTVDGAFLVNWVNEVRAQLQESGDLGTGDKQIGKLLATARPNGEGQWPPPEVCDVIEKVASKALDQGFYFGKCNLRDGTIRWPDDGGEQERELAQQYEEQAEALEGSWSRVADILRNLACCYRSQAKAEDDQADLTQDL